MIRMMDMAGVSSLVLYGASWASYMSYFFRNKSWAKRGATLLLVSALGFHIAFTALRVTKYGSHPMTSVFEVLTLVALSLSLVYLSIETWQKNKSTGVFILPLVILAQLIALSGIEPSYNDNPILKDASFALHTGTMTLGYVAFFLSAVYGLMYIIFLRGLKKKRYGLVFERLPSLDALVRMTFGSAVVGFVFLTISIGVGLAWASHFPQYHLRDPKVQLTLAVWAVYAVLFACRSLMKLDDRKQVSVILFGFLLLVVSTLAVNAFLPGWHRFGVQ